MCGIAGVLSGTGGRKESLYQELMTMVQVISHRGPDHQGLWVDADEHVSIGLGHRRLSIIDTVETSNQPMHEASGRFILVFNGEIYNYRELRGELESVGETFSTHSDTEVLLLACRRWGVPETLTKLIGMFAFSLWDKRFRLLYLARDRAGKKPLYYCRSNGDLYFSSEIKSLKANSRIQLSNNTESIFHYLSLGFIPGERTIYNEISEVPAGQWMCFDIDGIKNKERYWQPAAIGLKHNDFTASVDEVRQLLNDSIKIRLRADVPVGVFLSGGIDSGLITALAASHVSSPLQTFTVSFGNADFDESKLAYSVAERYGTDHEVISLNPDLEDIIPRVVASYDEPFADPSAIPTYAVSEAASKHIKVVLNGEGADELFGGYRRHTAIKSFSKLQRILSIIPERVIGGVFNHLPKPSVSRSAYGFAHRFLRGLNASEVERYLIWSSDGFSESEKREYWRGAQVQKNTADALEKELEYLGHRGTISDFMAMDFVVGMGQCLLVKMDIASMAHSLEARSPFLDHRLVDFAFGLDRGVVLKGRGTKPILRELAKQYLPDDVVTAPKRGFVIPLQDWLENDLKGMVNEACLRPNGLLSELFGMQQVTKMLDSSLTADPGQWAKRVWMLFMLAMWDSHASSH